MSSLSSCSALVHSNWCFCCYLNYLILIKPALLMLAPSIRSSITRLEITLKMLILIIYKSAVYICSDQINKMRI